ncbi:hypothetical protein QQS21_004139 [Conoideocrella luteorostrata]|uniref:Rhodopsin domain-containing protein n=1 Tax=Conoideocrella luteorostrata TaxID=1105319 RepID=A0AAJ0CRX3_9HYPO|nr:hypothetical protein QQS21_004139 [Conoideocrella luteorostrata]
MATSPPPMTAAQRELYSEDRRPQIYAALITLLVINNVIASGRIWVHWKVYYRHHRSLRQVFAEDYCILLSALCIDAVIGNLLAATHYGLGLHSWRINIEDPDFPSNLSHTFKHVWATMLLTGPTFSLIKLALLFFYRRLFLVNQAWLRIAWWANMVYVLLWLIGATGFYAFQCWPPIYYFMQYYHRYNRPPPYPITGQCNATTVTNVSIPLIFGLFSDIMVLILPVATIFRLHMTRKAKIGLTLVFSVGLIACLLDMVRIVELNFDTDDKIDPSYGVVIFLILSAATEVAAVVCASMPVIGPQVLRHYLPHSHPSDPYDSNRLSDGRHRHAAGGFKQLSHSQEQNSLKAEDGIGLNVINVRGNEPTQVRRKPMTDCSIWVQNEVEVTVDHSRAAREEMKRGEV